MKVYVLRAWYMREIIAITKSLERAEAWVEEDEEHFYDEMEVED